MRYFYKLLLSGHLGRSRRCPFCRGFNVSYLTSENQWVSVNTKNERRDDVRNTNQRAIVFIQLHIHLLCTVFCPLSVVMAALHEKNVSLI